MCLGIPGEVVELLPNHPDLARVEVSGVRRAVNIGLLADEPPQPGDWVLIHVGFAMSNWMRPGEGDAGFPRRGGAGVPTSCTRFAQHQ